MSKFLPFEQPVYLYSVREKFSSLVRQDEIVLEGKGNHHLTSEFVESNATSNEHHINVNEYNPLLEEEKVPLNNVAIIYAPDEHEYYQTNDVPMHQLDVKVKDNSHSSSNTSKLNASNLALHIESQRSYQEDCDAISSSRETEFSASNAPLFML